MSLANIEQKMVPCYYNNLLLYDIHAVIGTPREEFTFSRSADEFYHPGVRDMMIKYGPSSDAESSGLDGRRRFVTSLLQTQQDASIEQVNQTLEFLQENVIESHRLTGPMIEKCNKWMQKWGRTAISSEQELAMDVLQVTSNPIVGQKFGTSAANSCISTSALAITSMVLKADYK